MIDNPIRLQYDHHILVNSFINNIDVYKSFKLTYFPKRQVGTISTIFSLLTKLQINHAREKNLRKKPFSSL